MTEKMKRIQRKGLYDWSWKEKAIYVGRPSKWGNPFKVKDYGLKRCLELYEEWLDNRIREIPGFLDELKGKNLVCWCPLNHPFHADIIIKKLEAKA